MSLSVGGSKLETSFPLVFEPGGLGDFLGERSSGWEAGGDLRSFPFLSACGEVILVLCLPIGGMTWGDLTLLGRAGIGRWAKSSTAGVGEGRAGRAAVGGTAGGTAAGGAPGPAGESGGHSVNNLSVME